MAVDQIAEILNTMRVENQNNSENFERVLITLNNKLDMMYEDNEATDLLKVYITELKNVVLENYNNTVAKFEEIHTSLNELSLAGESNAKSEELGAFKTIVADNLSSLAAKLSEQKESLEHLQLKFEQDIDSLDFNRQENHAELKEELSDILLSLRNIADMNPTDSLEELSNFANIMSENISSFNNEFRQAVQNDLANSSKMMDEISAVSQKVVDSEYAIRETSDLNFQEIKSMIESLEVNLSDDVKNTVLQEQLQRLEDEYLNIVTIQDFANFKSDFSDFLQKMLDNANVLNINSDINKDQIAIIAEKINSLDYSGDFEYLADRISDFRESFDNNSKMNYENIVNEINCLKEELNAKLSNQDDSHNERYSAVNSLLNEVSSNIQFLRDFSTQKSNDTLNIVTSHINTVSDEIKESVNNNSRVNFDSLKELISAAANELEGVKETLVQNNDSNLFTMSASFNDIKVSLESVLSLFDNLSSSFNETSARNYSNLSENLDEINSRVDELRLVITGLANDYNEKLFAAVKDMSEKLETLSENDNEFQTLCALINTLAAQVQEHQNDTLDEIKELNEVHSTELKVVSQNLSDFEEKISHILDNLKEEFSNIDLNSSDEELQKKITEKLLDLEAAIVGSSDEYNNKLLLLQEKISEFAQIVENSAADTEGKIANSLEEIADIKGQLVVVGESLKSSNDFSDEKFSEVLCRLEAGISNIISNIENTNSAFSQGFYEALKENSINAEERFTSLLALIDGIKEVSEDDALIESVEQKVEILKDELRLVNTDIVDAYQCKSEEILRAFDSVKSEIVQLSTIDFEKTITELKSHFELMFVDLSERLSQNDDSELYGKIEQVYKEMFNKVSNIEDYVTENIHENIELLNAALQACHIDLRDSFGGKLAEGISDLKAYFETLITGLLNTGEIEALRDELLDKLDSISETLEAQPDYSFEIASLESKLKDYIEEKSSNVIDSVTSNIAEKFDNDQAKNLIEALHAKVDVLAMGINDFNVEDEIDEIKDLIFEQRKFFEASSDEKTAAIDKYLRDVLLKLDSVDIEKNAEDIKDTIINTLVSLVNEISFVEETEDIKDFVEEKTDQINQNLLEVQNQLKQITNTNDDFDYSYTLQDVESDIARLRLAINNVSATDFEGFSDEIKKIALSIDGLQSSLTQEQTVDLKNDIEKLKEDIISISSRTNKLLLTSDESYKVLSDGLNNFSEIIYKLEDRINYLDNTAISERIERKLDNVHSLAVETVNSDKIFHQVMTYLGEWIDSTTENISSISDKTSEINSIKETVQELREAVPDKAELLNEIEFKFKQQEERIDNLETKLEKILSTLEEKDDMVLNRKVDNIEKILFTLGANIEKLASYVDEE